MSQTCADARALKVYGNADATVVLTVLHGARLQSRLVLCPLFGDAQQVKYVALEPLGQRREEAMMLRIIHGKLKPGTWDSYERAYKDVMAKAGKIPGLRGRWLAHAVDDPDAGYTMSLWENEAAMRSYENGEILQTTILPRLKPFFSGDYTTTRCEVRFAEEFDQ
jgi:heme-degrading monooxygenase HmoA